MVLSMGDWLDAVTMRRTLQLAAKTQVGYEVW